jgi:hypothetical protein
MSVDPRLVLLLVGLLLVGVELHTWLWHGGPHHDRRYGQVCWAALQLQCGGDEDTQGYHVAPSRAGGSGAFSFAQGSAAFVRGILEVCRDGDPLCTIPMNKAPESVIKEETPATKAVGNELQDAHADGFARSEAITDRVTTIGNESKFW